MEALEVVGVKDAPLEGAGVFPFEPDGGLWDCSLLLSWVEDMAVAGWLADWLACSNAGGSSPIWSCYFAVFRVANRARVDALAT